MSLLLDFDIKPSWKPAHKSADQSWPIKQSNVTFAGTQIDERKSWTLGHGKSWTLAHGWEKSHGPWVMDVLGSVSFSVVHLMLLRQDLLVVRTGKNMSCISFLKSTCLKNNGWITCSGRTSRRQRSLGSPAVCNSWWTDSPQPETQEINLSLLQKLYSWLRTWSTSVDFISPFPLSFVSSRQPMLLFGRRWRCLWVRFFWISFQIPIMIVWQNFQYLFA